MGQVSIVAYRPKPEKAEELLALTLSHHAALREFGLVTERAAIVTRAADGTLVEVFEWVPGGAERAHEHPGVAQLWGRYQSLCDYVPLGELAERAGLFASFEAVN